jgi:hypothetical protein
VSTKLEKTAQFLKKVAAEGGSIWNKSLYGGPEAPFQQPSHYPAEVIHRLLAEADKLPEGSDEAAAAASARQAITEAGGMHKLDQAGIDRIAVRAGASPADKNTPGFWSNYRAAMGRGHLGATAATVGIGAAAVLAGVLTYNALKKKRTQTKTAGLFSFRRSNSPNAQGPAPTRAAERTQKVRDLVGKKVRNAALLAGGGGALAGTAAGAALASPGDTVAGGHGLPTTGSNLGDAAVLAGGLGLGGAGLYALYRSLRDE